MLGEITPSIMAFMLGIIFGTQLAHKITGRVAILVIMFSVIGALLFGTFTFTYSIYGGYIMPGLGFDVPLITATIGVIVGKLLRGN